MSNLVRVFAPALLSAVAVAQTWTLPLDPRATFLRTNGDTATSPLVLDLGAMGITPGSCLRVGTTGAFRHINGGPDNYYNLVGVFSGSNTLLPSNVQARVPAAIAAGPAFASGGTYVGNLPMDIPQDFFCSRNLWDESLMVRVPAGATFLFLGVHDSLYNDNVDPNGDFAAVVTLLPTSPLPGTGEHVELRTAVASTPTAFPELHATTAGAAMIAELRYPVGFADGSLYVFLGDTVTSGNLPFELLPNLWTPNLFVLQAGLLPSTAAWSATWSMAAPAGLSGVTLVVQGGALVSTARNGLYVTTNAHRFVL
ncbi:MAG: hypothetical protein JNK15_04105 [Planctomycetes bacterium]|nr:hypothetical protein [Planctomycetota bacterium]